MSTFELRGHAHDQSGERPSDSAAATKRTIDADRTRVLELLQRLQRFVRGGGVRMWDGIDEHQAHADLEYAADAVRRFPGPRDEYDEHLTEALRHA